MRLNASQNVIPAIGWMSGTISGTSTAARMFIRTMYVVMPGTSPPSLRVTTAAAVAVGHIRQSIALSIRTLASCAPPGRYLEIRTTPRPRTVKSPPWIRSSHQCHLCGLSSFGSILQKVRKSIAKISRGWMTATILFRKGPARCTGPGIT